jgi:DNA primase
MRYPEDLIEQVRRQSDIVEIIGESVSLRRSGRGYIGLCPFHPDKHPSMNVNPELGIFKCFSCGKGGNIITFVMEKQGLNFVEAVQQLAGRAGIPLPEEEEKDPAAREQYNRREAALKVLSAASAWYTAALNTIEGKAVARYFASRGFGADIITRFGLGFAPDSWTATLQELQRQGFSEQAMEDAGLILRREKDGSAYDRFRGRAIFPIHDPLGRVIGFGARRMNDQDNQPKYINSPQSLVYDKSRVLYGLFQARAAIRNQGMAILTEGYADTISLVQAGFENVIASSGTALTPEQLQLLSRYCKQVCIVYDGDEAGINAAMRGIERAVAAGFEVKVVKLPPGEDPDSFVRKKGADEFRRLLLDAQSFLLFKADILEASGAMNTPAGKAGALRSLIGTIAQVPDLLQHDFLIQQLANRLHLSHSQLEHVYAELGKSRRAAIGGAETADIRSENPGALARRKTDIAQLPEQNAIQTQSANTARSTYPEEAEALRIALTVPNALRYMIQVLNLHSDAFLSTGARLLYEYAMQTLAEKGDKQLVQELVQDNSISPEARELLMEIAFARPQPSNTWSRFNVQMPPENNQRMLMECLAKLRLRHLSLELEQLQFELQNNPNAQREAELLQRISSLLQEKHAIPAKFHSSAI